MALDISTQTIEIERVQGTKSIQILTRAEAQVTGAGREAVEVLLTEAEVIISSAQAQEGRVMIEATLFCQGVYRQGDETILRALTASAPVSQAVEIPGTQPGMRAQACANVEHMREMLKKVPAWFGGVDTEARVYAVWAAWFSSSPRP